MSSNENKNATAAKEPVMVTLEAGKQVEARTLKASDHVKAFDPVIIVITMLASCLGAIIGLELMTRVGVNQNTSIIGALIAVVLSMIPGKVFRRFKNIHAQNLVQTSISGASYAAANAMILPIGIPVLMGRPDLLFPVLIGVTLATIVDGFLIYKVFDSPMFAATNPFPYGIATSETILALANRGKRSLLLFVGMGAGVAGKAIGIPMDLFGVSWFGNVIAMMAFAAGSIVKGSLIPMWTAAISVDGVVPEIHPRAHFAAHDGRRRHGLSGSGGACPRQEEQEERREDRSGYDQRALRYHGEHAQVPRPRLRAVPRRCDPAGVHHRHLHRHGRWSARGLDPLCSLRCHRF